MTGGGVGLFVALLCSLAVPRARSDGQPAMIGRAGFPDSAANEDGAEAGFGVSYGGVPLDTRWSVSGGSFCDPLTHGATADSITLPGESLPLQVYEPRHAGNIYLTRWATTPRSNIQFSNKFLHPMPPFVSLFQF